MNPFHYDFIRNVSSLFQSIFRVQEDVADFIGCQFALESSYGESPLAKTHHNYCGMRTPLVRVSVASNYRDPDEKWARYDDLLHCVYDFMFCLAYRKPMSSVFETINQYKAFIKGWYCPESSYLSKINQIYQSFINLKQNKDG